MESQKSSWGNFLGNVSLGTFYIFTSLVNAVAMEKFLENETSLQSSSGYPAILVGLSMCVATPLAAGIDLILGEYNQFFDN